VDASRRPYLLMLAIFSMTLLDFLQNGMVAFSAAPIMGNIGVGPQEYSRVAGAYASVAVVVIALQRWTVEHIGWRRYFQVTLVVVAVGALICAVVETYAGFFMGRCVMAVGTGGILTGARLSVNHIPPGPRRFLGIKALATPLCIGTAAAPWLATAVAEDGGINRIFWLVAVLALLAVIPATLALPVAAPSTEKRSHLRPLRLALLAGAAFLLLYTLQRSFYDFYSDRLLLVTTGTTGAAGALWFGWSEARSSQPLLRLGNLLETRYIAGLLLFLFCYTTLGANGYLIPIMMQRSLGLSWTTTGDVYAAGLAGGVVAWLAMSRMLPRWPSPRKYFTAGFLALALSCFLLSRLSPAPEIWRHLWPPLMLYGSFIMLVMPTTAMQTFAGVSQDDSVFSDAQQVKNMLAQLGQAFGITLATVGQQWLTARNYSALRDRVDFSDPRFLELHSQYTEHFAHSSSAGDAAAMSFVQIAQAAEQQAALLANIEHFRLFAALAVVAAVVSLAQRILR
jgi:DHA2 family multidrug resistance protein